MYSSWTNKHYIIEKHIRNVSFQANHIRNVNFQALDNCKGSESTHWHVIQVTGMLIFDKYCFQSLFYKDLYVLCVLNKTNLYQVLFICYEFS